jgi:hypothetical protein
LWHGLSEKSGGGVQFSQKEVDGIRSGSAKGAFGYSDNVRARSTTKNEQVDYVHQLLVSAGEE